uniref:Uncharacterized protein n=1 Tax=Micrurus lemniscatus lemniscatus TaxID=129467 RepID=A0A2D4J2I9_MICLE
MFLLHIFNFLTSRNGSFFLQTGWMAGLFLHFCWGRVQQCFLFHKISLINFTRVNGKRVGKGEGTGNTSDGIEEIVLSTSSICVKRAATRQRENTTWAGARSSLEGQNNKRKWGL